MPDTLHLDLATRPAGGARRWEITLRRDGATAEPVRLWYELLDGGDAEPPVLDGWVFAVLLYAMKIGTRLAVHGPLSRTALYNMEEVQAFWHLWRPALYQRIEIVPDSIVDLERRKSGRRAIAAFSGGADSSFTLLRHRTRLAGDASYNLDTVAMVHGFDVTLNNPDHFDGLVRRTEPFLAALGIALKTVRTNSKQLTLMAWEDTFSAQLAGCLHLFARDFEFGLVGSSEPYNDLFLPWGSNPITDGLLSGDGFAIVHDGAGFSRTEKIAALARNPACVAVLKVCWEGKAQDRNCGVCEKCVRTRLNFLAAGEAKPACFDTPFDPASIDTISIRNRAIFVELRQIARYAESHGVDGPWLARLNERLRAYGREERWDARRQQLIATLEAVGLKETVKRGLRLFGRAG
jgi:hypothetical protein